MALDPNGFEFQLFFILTLIILGTKLLIFLMLTRKIIKRKREEGKIKLDFVLGAQVLVLCLFISRLFFIYFDFVLTQFDSNLYYLMPNVVYWKLGMFTSNLGLVFIIYITDKKALNFKFKGIFCIIILIGSSVFLLYPVDSPSGFSTISAISLITNGMSLIIPILFIYLGIKTPGFRKISLLVTLGFLCYVLGGLLVNEAILTQLRNLFGDQVHISVFLLFMILKITGLSILSYAVTKFSI
jgi:hypothetical protein